jgi:pyruvate/2-oxoglutarate dehydrogenase complex dihydrolipoamide acyltransferase (E2) component
MAKDILMPMLSPSMTEGTLVRWIKKEGDAVKSGDVLAEVETDKATMDLEAFDAGILRKILVPEGEKVAVNAKIGIIGTKDEKIDESASAPAPRRPPRLRRRKHPPPRRPRFPRNRRRRLPFPNR